MGPEVTIQSIEVIQAGLIQIDFWVEEENRAYRCFIEPEKLFGMIGASMQANYNKFLDSFFAEEQKEAP